MFLCNFKLIENFQEQYNEFSHRLYPDYYLHFAQLLYCYLSPLHPPSPFPSTFLSLLRTVGNIYSINLVYFSVSFLRARISSYHRTVIKIRKFNIDIILPNLQFIFEFVNYSNNVLCTHSSSLFCPVQNHMLHIVFLFFKVLL